MRAAAGPSLRLTQPGRPGCNLGPNQLRLRLNAAAPVRAERERESLTKSARGDELRQLARHQGLRDAEALAETFALGGAAELTAAWEALPSRILGPKQSNTSYAEGIRMYLSQGGAMQHAASGGQGRSEPLRVAVPAAGAGGVTPHALLEEAARRGLLSRSAEERCRSAVEAELQQLPDVESHLQPEALARVLAHAPTSKLAVHVAAMADAAWHNTPSKVLGPRPAWLQWSYGELLLLAASIGVARVKRALQQPCMELACMELQPHGKVKAGAENVSRIFGASLPQLLEEGRLPALGQAVSQRQSWGSGLSNIPSTTSQNGFQLTADWQQRLPVEGELLQLCILQREGSSRVVEFSPPSQVPTAVDPSAFSLPPAVVAALLPWADIERGHDLRVKGWGAVQEPHWLQRWEDRPLPTPTQVRAHGYTAQLFPNVDAYSAVQLRGILSHPSSAVAKYVVKWHEKLNGALAARVDELEEAELDDAALDLPPETLLRRLERERAVAAVPLETFDWLAGDAEGPRILATVASPAGAGAGAGAEMHVLLLTTSQQIVRAGLALRNCASSCISPVREMQEMLLVLCQGRDIEEAKAMAAWTREDGFSLGGGEWSQMYESCNRPIRPEWKAMFVQTEAQVTEIWDRAIQQRLELHRELKQKIRRCSLPTQMTAAIAECGSSQEILASVVAGVLATVGLHRPVKGSELAGRLVAAGQQLQGAGQPLFAARRYCGYSKLKSFTANLPTQLTWECGGPGYTSTVTWTSIERR